MSIRGFALEFTIANGASASGNVAAGQVQHISFFMPTAWTAAALAVQISRLQAAPSVDADWHTLTDALGEVSLPAAAGRVLVLPTSVLIPACNWIRVISGTVSARVPQGAARVIPAIARTY